MSSLLPVSSYDKHFDFFSPLSTDLVVSSEDTVYYSPVNFDSEANFLQWKLPPKFNQFLKLNEIELCVKVKLVKATGDLDETKENGDLVGVVNLTLHSLFSSMEIRLNDTPVGPSGYLYPYKAYFINLFSTTKTNKETEKELEGYIQDTGSNFDALMKNGAVNDKGETTGFKWASDNFGMLKRTERYSSNNTVILYGRPQIDFLNSKRVLIPWTEVTINMRRSSHAFALMAKKDSDAGFKLKIVEATLCCKYLKVEAPILDKIHRSLRTRAAIYPYFEHRMISYNIPSGSQSSVRDPLSSSTVPEVVLIGLIGESRVVGRWEKNGLKFNHFNLQSVTLSINSQIVGSKPIVFPKDSDYCEGYRRIYTDLPLCDSGLERTTFKEDYFILPISLKPQGINSPVSAPPRNGTLRLDLVFHEALTETVTVMVMLGYSRILTISHSGEVTQEL